MSSEHEWTVFEEHTLLCLICRNIHITGFHPEEAETFLSASGKKFAKMSSKREEKEQGLQGTKKHAHTDVATLLNAALHGSDYQKDISAVEVSKKIDKVLSEKKAALKFMERNAKGRVTGAIKKIWQRGLQFDGTEREWRCGRKEIEVTKNNLGNPGAQGKISDHLSGDATIADNETLSAGERLSSKNNIMAAANYGIGLGPTSNDTSGNLPLIIKTNASDSWRNATPRSKSYVPNSKPRTATPISLPLTSGDGTRRYMAPSQLYQSWAGPGMVNTSSLPSQIVDSLGRASETWAKNDFFQIHTTMSDIVQDKSQPPMSENTTSSPFTNLPSSASANADHVSMASIGYNTDHHGTTPVPDIESDNNRDV
jgi:hypothetical protein